MSTNRDAFDQAVGHWNAGDLDSYLDLYDPTVKMYGGAPETLDRAGIAEAYRGIWATFGSPPPLEIHDVVEEGDSLVARFTMRGTHAGEFFGIAPTGRPIELNGMTLLRFRAGRCVERWNSTDMLAVLLGLGAVPIVP